MAFRLRVYLMSWLRTNGFVVISHASACLPLLVLIWDSASGNLSVNPIQDATFRTGKAALLMLMLSLACTPLHTVTGFKPALRMRNWFGLYAFLYAGLHFLVFSALDFGLDWVLIGREIVEKRYILAGLAALVILVPLAVTSTQGWQRRLGKMWKRLHRLAYLAGVLAVLHYVWLVKSDVREPLLWSTVLAVLLILRIPRVRARVSRLRMR
ncbi:MAG: protein-methionine-sulfoxide reductase heme-binding subunit MsrQ [Anaerolineae bacterium]|nr:sulfoxide reductase heme-binding subunit YedZ [Thermoflexales bacterium]MDW8408861.1 protein-methionine-sulfoxide reductase heme-binding subunit MsrQ [Anaerolineae bacterium]